MADAQVQTAASHAHRPMASGVAGLLTILALAIFIVEMSRRPGLLPLGLLCLAGAVATLTVISRTYIVRLQDRIIRLEMRVRLARLGLDADFERLTKRQLVALRFASDAELPALARRALAENLTGRQIKEAVRDWQPDHYRT